MKSPRFKKNSEGAFLKNIEKGFPISTPFHLK